MAQSYTTSLTKSGLRNESSVFQEKEKWNIYSQFVPIMTENTVTSATVTPVRVATFENLYIFQRVFLSIYIAYFSAIHTL